MAVFPLKLLWPMLVIAMLMPPCVAVETPETEPHAPRILSSAMEVRQLNPEEAAKALPVHLQGTLLFVGSDHATMMIHDHGEGLFVRTQRHLVKNLIPGDWLEIEGVSKPGDFAPMMEATKVVRLGHRGLPDPQRTTLGEVSTGGLDAAWIEIEGIVRGYTRVKEQETHGAETRTQPSGHQGRICTWNVLLAHGNTRMQIQIRQSADKVEAMVDAKISVRGVAFSVHNASRQFVRAHVHAANPDMVRVLSKPVKDAFSLPLRRAAEVSCFSREGFSGHRVRVQGVVTALQDGKQLWLRDGDHGLSVECSQETTVSPGDKVDIAGFPRHGGYAPRLEDATVLKVTAGAPEEPVTLQSSDDVGLQESNLVQINAELSSVRLDTGEINLLLQWKDREVAARLRKPTEMKVPRNWQAGAKVSVTGICLIGRDRSEAQSGLWVANDLQLLLRDISDLQVLRPAPWATPQRKLAVMGTVSGALLLILVLVVLRNRRQISRREQARRMAEIEFSAILSERNRLARELHDTIAQNLNAVSIQLELARSQAPTSTEGGPPSHTEMAHKIVRHTMTEVRESIWNMRSHILEKTDLVGALRTLVNLLGSSSDCTISVRSEGTPRRLAPLTENNLLRIGQEAISNALNHSGATEIELVVVFEPRIVRLRARDNGRGFDPSTAGTGHGGFGLQGMKERALQMSGELQIISSPGTGTTIEITAPLPD